MLRQRKWYYNYSSHNDWDGNNPASKMPNEWCSSQQNEQYKLGNRVITNITLTNTIFAYINFQTRDCEKVSLNISKTQNKYFELCFLFHHHSFIYFSFQRGMYLCSYPYIFHIGLLCWCWCWCDFLSKTQRKI